MRHEVAGHRYPGLYKRMFPAVLKSLSVQNQVGERNSAALEIQDDPEGMLEFYATRTACRKKNRDLCLLPANVFVLSIFKKTPKREN